MLKSVLLCIFVAYSNFVSAQLSKEDLRIGVLIEHSQYFDKILEPRYSLAGGLDMQLMVTDWLGLDYQFLAGVNQGYGFYFNTGWGQVASIYLYSQNLNSLGSLALLALVIPEGISLHIPLGAQMRLQPYLHPFEADFNYFDNPRLHWAGEWGMRVSYQFKNGMSLQPHIGGRWWYFRKKIGLNVGLSFTFFNKNKP